MSDTDGEQWEVVADIVTEDGYPLSVTSSDIPSKEVAESIIDDLEEKHAVRSLLVQKGDRFDE